MHQYYTDTEENESYTHHSKNILLQILFWKIYKPCERLT